VTNRPSSKIFALSIAAILIVGSAIYLKYWSPDAKLKASTLSYQQGSAQAGGLDPVTQALQDEFLKPPSADTAFSSPNFSEGDNLTTRFAKSAFASYVSLQNAGASDEDSQQNVVDNMVTNASTIANAEKYSAYNVKTFTPKNKDEIRAYGNAFSQTQDDYLSLAAKDPKKYEDMQAFADLYERISIDLGKLAAPQELAAAHLAMMNYFYDLSRDYRDIDKSDEDPLKGLLAIKDVKRIEDETPGVFTTFSNYFKANGILFTEDESGYGLTQ
jgi:hypothetical protein